jgi:TolB-like protein/Flp pilus assembly protein TadD
MAAEVKKEIQLEIGHVLFIDIVGYSKLLINQQSEVQRELNEIVSATKQFRAADAEGKLIRLPTGDGMALVFRNHPEAPAQCALEISEALKSHPSIQLRMGVHSGPVNEIADVNQRANMAGAGINIAQRVMDCGDAGHILLSKHVAEDLEHYDHWQPHLHDLGECEVKHGVRLSIVNLYTDELGNSAVPAKFKNAASSTVATSTIKPPDRKWPVIAALALILGAAVIGALMFRAKQVPPAPAASGSVAPTAAPVVNKSIAVLPFENFSADPENAFFADGMQDDILTALSRIADLKVISRTSVMTYRAGAHRNLREIAQALGVAHILEGSVRRAGRKIRVTAQLIDAKSDAHLWADTYDREVEDVFAIQSDIALQIATQLRAKLSPTIRSAIEERPTQDLAAYGLYVRAKTLTEIPFIDSRNLDEAISLLDQAVVRDPSFFLAYCTLVKVHAWVYFFWDHTSARRDLAKAALDGAARLRPDAGETHLARAEYHYRCEGDYEKARAEVALAQRTLPRDTRVFTLLSLMDMRQGRLEESIRNREKALELDPRSLQGLRILFWKYWLLRRYPEAALTLERALAVSPAEPGSRVLRAKLELDWRADTKPLHEMFEVLVNEDPAAASTWSHIWLELALCERDPAAADRALVGIEVLNVDALSFPGAWFQGLAARDRGDETAARTAFTAALAEAEKEVRDHPDYGPPLCVLGLVHAALGRKEEAIREGRRALELLPVAKDAINGGHITGFLAVIYAWTGEKDLAVEQIAAAVRSFDGLCHYGGLRLHPYWDPLRGDPRFEKLVASLAPKEKP